MSTVEKKYKLTQHKVNELKAELLHRKTTKKKEFRELLYDSKQEGDDRENEGYRLTYDMIEENDRKIVEIKEILLNTEIIATEKQPNESLVVDIGRKVKIEINGKASEFTLCTPPEADPFQNKLSSESPIGRAIMGESVGFGATIKLPEEEKHIKIMEIF